MFDPNNLLTLTIATQVTLTLPLNQSCRVEVVEFLESFPLSPEADGGGGGVVAEIFRHFKMPNIRWHTEFKCITPIMAIFVKKNIFKHNFIFMRVQANVKIRRSMFGLWATL